MTKPNVFVCGSLNIDYVYSVVHIAQPGETISSTSLTVCDGGKGLNQAIAAARAGANVSFIGHVGHDGLRLKSQLLEDQVDITGVQIVEGPSGHAIIQVVEDGSNAIIVCPGANRTLEAADIESFVKKAKKGDVLVLQNETNMVAQFMQAARDKGLTVVFNPSPLSDQVRHYPLALVDVLILNQYEAEYLSGESSVDDALEYLSDLLPASAIVVTRGDVGSIYQKSNIRIVAEAVRVPAVDSTAAGDCFLGYFIAAMTAGKAPEECLKIASHAAAISVTRSGAAKSIPFFYELDRS